MKENQTCIRILADRAQIDQCRNRLVTHNEAFTHIGKVLALAGNEVRLKILFLLDEEEELCPCDLSDIHGMSIPAVSQHLRKLKDGEMVTPRRVGQTIFYSLKKEEMRLLQPLFQQINNYHIRKLNHA